MDKICTMKTVVNLRFKHFVEIRDHISNCTKIFSHIAKNKENVNIGKYFRQHNIALRTVL